MIFPKRHYQTVSYFVLIMIHFIPMTVKYFKVLSRQIYFIFKKSNIVNQLMFPHFDSDVKDKCFDCHFCEKVCPTNAIQLSFKGKNLTQFRLDLIQCTRCQICQQACPEKLIGRLGVNLQCTDLNSHQNYIDSFPKS